MMLNYTVAYCAKAAIQKPLDIFPFNITLLPAVTTYTYPWCCRFMVHLGNKSRSVNAFFYFRNAFPYMKPEGPSDPPWAIFKMLTFGEAAFSSCTNLLENQRAVS